MQQEVILYIPLFSVDSGIYFDCCLGFINSPKLCLCQKMHQELMVQSA
jgi:hypothetical protein